VTDCASEHCITCSDEGVAMRIESIDDGLARCRDEAGNGHEVAVELVEPVALGDRVLVHAGVAIAMVALAEARP
jgi:hydrogenase expression/formation protein HypC